MCYRINYTDYQDYEQRIGKEEKSLAVRKERDETLKAVREGTLGCAWDDPAKHQFQPPWARDETGLVPLEPDKYQQTIKKEHRTFVQREARNTLIATLRTGRTVGAGRPRVPSARESDEVTLTTTESNPSLWSRWSPSSPALGMRTPSGDSCQDSAGASPSSGRRQGRSIRAIKEELDAQRPLCVPPWNRDESGTIPFEPYAFSQQIRKEHRTFAVRQSCNEALLQRERERSSLDAAGAREAGEGALAQSHSSPMLRGGPSPKRLAARSMGGAPRAVVQRHGLGAGRSGDSAQAPEAAWRSPPRPQARDYWATGVAHLDKWR